MKGSPHRPAPAEQEKPVAESHGNVKGATAHTAADGGHKAPFPPFQKDTFASQLVSLLIAFAALYLIVSRIALPRVGSLLDGRQDPSEAERRTREERLAVKLADAEKTIAATREAAMRNVRGIAAEAAAAIVQRLTGVLPDGKSVKRPV